MSKNSKSKKQRVRVTDRDGRALWPLLVFPDSYIIIKFPPGGIFCLLAAL